MKYIVIYRTQNNSMLGYSTYYTVLEGVSEKEAIIYGEDHFGRDFVEVCSVQTIPA